MGTYSVISYDSSIVNLVKECQNYWLIECVKTIDLIFSFEFCFTKLILIHEIIKNKLIYIFS